MLQSFFGRQGGKNYQRKEVLSRFPKVNTYNRYVEPFIGAGSIMLNSPKVDQMFASDSDTQVIDVFVCFKDVSLEDIRNYSLFVSKEEFLKIKKSMKETKPTDNVERLKNNLILLKNSYMCYGLTYGCKKARSNEYFGIKLKKNAEKIKAKLNEYTSITKKDYKEAIEEHDSEDTFFYLDPPYLETDSRGYETGNINHEELLSLLKNIKGKFLLSYNDHPKIKEMYKDFTVEVIVARQTASKGMQGGSVVMTEVLIRNY